MLFPIDPTTPECKVFEVLNNELLYFLQLSISATDFNEDLFSCYRVVKRAGPQFIRSVCWTNTPTRTKFSELWSVLPDNIQDRQDLYDLVNDSQNIVDYFNDITRLLPNITDELLFGAMKSLTTFLFENTKKRSSAIREAGTSISLHYQAYLRANNNSTLCYCCGTEKLSQNRVGINDEKQWIAAYDHILPKATNPIFSIHPDNFLPTCYTCNSKAKLANELLVSKTGKRRKAYYPLAKIESETCYQYSKVFPVFLGLSDYVNGNWEQPLDSVKVTFSMAPVISMRKIVVWKEVYQVPNRVAFEVKNGFVESISSALIEPQNYAEFRDGIARKVARIPTDLKKNAWSCWWYKVFQWLDSQPQCVLEDIWKMFEWKLRLASDDNLTAEDDYYATFGY